MTMDIEQAKSDICSIGERLYKRGFAAGNDGNISYRLDEDTVICTPTMFCKGFMRPEDLCVVNMEGTQVEGTRKTTSEIRLHLAIMRERPEVKSVVHCHPPYATAFGIAREPIPSCALPEIEIQLGEIPIAPYAIPGGQKFADTILPFVHQTRIIVLANHGTVSWGETPELAYWWAEMLDAYCRMLILAKQIGNVGYFSQDEMQELITLKQNLGIADPRIGSNCDLCANEMFQSLWETAGLARRGFKISPHTMKNASNEETSGTVAAILEKLSETEQEMLVRSITGKVISELRNAPK